MRALVSQVVLAVVLVACGGGSKPAPTGPTGPKPPPTTDARKAAPTGGAHATAGGSVAVPDIGCPTETCVFHPGPALYFTCTSSGAGSCFHFGPPCTPPDACMFDPASRTYKTCAKPVEGACQRWGKACAPANKCMFDARDGYYRQCEDVAGGTCKRYGALCAP